MFFSFFKLSEAFQTLPSRSALHTLKILNLKLIFYVITSKFTVNFFKSMFHACIKSGFVMSNVGFSSFRFMVMVRLFYFNCFFIPFYWL